MEKMRERRNGAGWEIAFIYDAQSKHMYTYATYSIEDTQ
jgi:hypothetical protein